MIKKLIVWLIAAVSLGLMTCDIDRGLAPTRSGISGTVYYLKEWPKNTDIVMVVGATRFPPTSINDIIMSEPIAAFTDSAEYVIYAPPITFEAVGVVWKEVNQPWDVTNIIGIYFPTDNYFSPGKVTVPNNNTMVSGINIRADLSKARRKVDSAIQGMLRIKGAWPANAEQVLMVASPSILPGSLLDITFGTPIAAGFDSTTFSISVQPGTYRLIGALLIEQGRAIGVESIKAIYKKRPTDLLPAAVAVPTDTTVVRGINLTLDFGGN